MSNKPTIAIATNSEPVRESLGAWCHSQGITIEKQADLWLVDGHHTPSLSIPKGAKIVVLGPIPSDITPTHTIPSPASFDTIKEVLGRYLQSASISLKQGWTFDAQQRSLTHSKEKPIDLTEKESALLQQLLQVAPQEISREALLKNIWAYDKDVDTHTVETHIYRLRQKAGDAPFDIVTTESGYKVVL